MGKIGSKMGERNISIKNIKMFHSAEDKLSIELLIRLPADTKIDSVLRELAKIEGVYNVYVDM